MGPASATTRVAVFVDYQNTYMSARRAFATPFDPSPSGQFYPRRFGVMLAAKGRLVDPARQLEYISIFKGEPSSLHDPKGQAACDRQVRFWNAQAAVRATTRPLKYYPYTDRPAERAACRARRALTF